MDQDILYHLALGSGSHDLHEMFGDVKVEGLFSHKVIKKLSITVSDWDASVLKINCSKILTDGKRIENSFKIFNHPICQNFFSQAM